MAATPLIPDLNIVRRLGTYGDIVLIQVLDDQNNIVDLTTSSQVQIKIQHETISTDNVVRTALIQGVATNGIIYYVIQKIDFQNQGRYLISSIITYPISGSYPEGKNIISYKTSPNFIINN